MLAAMQGPLFEISWIGDMYIHVATAQPRSNFASLSIRRYVVAYRNFTRSFYCDAYQIACGEFSMSIVMQSFLLASASLSGFRFKTSNNQFWKLPLAECCSFARGGRACGEMSDTNLILPVLACAARHVMRLAVLD